MPTEEAIADPTEERSTALIEIRDAVFGYAGRPVVRVGELRLDRARCLGIFGPNGAGKTTLVRGITGLLRPMSGQVVRGRAGQPLRYGYLPQYRAIEHHWPMSGLDAAAMATSAFRPFGWLGPSSTHTVLKSMQSLGVDSLARRPFASLSGGQQQRILRAGAMASGPQVLVLDEPTDGLDVQSRQNLLDLLCDFTKAGLATVIISHEVEDLLYLCQEIAWLHPASDPGEPSTVERISPAALTERMLHAQRKGAPA